MQAPEFMTRTIMVIDEQRRQLALAMIANMPLGVEVVGRRSVKVRKQSQNDLMWAGPLKDISEQAWVDGRRFADKVWHDHFKALYMPDVDDPELSKRVRRHETYQKWDDTPGGDRVCIASTTDLTVFGFSEYLEQVYAFGAGMGVQFRASRGAS